MMKRPKGATLAEITGTDLCTANKITHLKTKE
jgi:hypothetical protein